MLSRSCWLRPTVRMLMHGAVKPRLRYWPTQAASGRQGAEMCMHVWTYQCTAASTRTLTPQATGAEGRWCL